jgi:UDPglucose 6-dehydrogenase
MIVRNQHADRLTFSTDLAAAVADSEIVFIAVGTPMGADGHADLSAVRAVAAAIVVSKSTVPVETGELCRASSPRTRPAIITSTW